MKRYRLIGFLTLVFLLANPVFAEKGNEALEMEIFSAAVVQSERVGEDRQWDDRRKPAQVLHFFGIRSGDTVIDVFAGGGYYSEILSYLVGDNGKVIAYNNKPWDDYVAKKLDQRFANNRLSNVERLVLSPEQLAQQSLEADAAIFILGMHDLYYADAKNGWPAIDRELFLKAIYDNLNEGAVFGVIDANAIAGVDVNEVSKKLHRIDPNVMIADIEEAGFVLEERSTILANEEDDKTSSVFEPQNRYRTDRSVLRFRKSSPE